MTKTASIYKQTEDGLTTYVVTTDVGQKTSQENIYDTFAAASAAIDAYLG